METSIASEPILLQQTICSGCAYSADNMQSLPRPQSNAYREHVVIALNRLPGRWQSSHLHPQCLHHRTAPAPPQSHCHTPAEAQPPALAAQQQSCASARSCAESTGYNDIQGKMQAPSLSEALYAELTYHDKSMRSLTADH